MLVSDPLLFVRPRGLDGERRSRILRLLAVRRYRVYRRIAAGLREVEARLSHISDSGALARPTCRLNLLGSFQLMASERHVPLALGTQRVLALLALRPRPQRRLALAATLWSDSSETRARASLRSALWRLRHIDRSLIHSCGDLLSLGRHVDVDIRYLEERARRLLTGDDLEGDGLRPADLLSQLLPGWDDEWLLLERERYRQLCLHAVEALCKRLAAVGLFADAIEAGLTLVHAEPLRESAHHALIAAYAAEGNRSEVLAQFRRCRDIMRSGLGVEPSPALRALAEATDDRSE